jgi:iron complex outermembrane receptor protein/outer membrane receptor for ferrienterochelin and colicins
MLGNSFTKSNSLGGDMQVIKNNASANHVYFEENITTRNTTTLEINKKWNDRSSSRIKQSLSIFDRKINIPSYSFAGINYNSFTDLSQLLKRKQHTIIFGFNFIADQFKQQLSARLNNRSTTIGLYAQDTWDITDRIKIESGLRMDNVTYSNSNFSKNQSFLLPRISALFKVNNNISSRISGGLGYKIPTPFTEQTESIQYQNLLPLNNVTAEKSVGGTFDINYKNKLLPDLLFSFNQMFFITAINKPLVLQTDVSGFHSFANAGKPLLSKGFETNVKLIFKERFKLFAGYTFVDAKAKYLTNNQYLPLTPKSKLNLALLYEQEGNIKIGLEGYFNGRQYLYNGYQTPAFAEFGFMVEKTIRKVSLFINFENFTDERQSKYKSVVNPPFTNPTFDDIWNHTEGFVVNGGIKLKF